MSLNYENPQLELKTPISHSDNAHADDNCPMSGTNHSRNPSPRSSLVVGVEQAALASAYCGNKEISSRTTASVSNLIESARQQHDRDFFEKFLRTPETNSHQQSQVLMDSNTNEPSSSTNHQASIIDQLLPQANQSTLLRSSSYLMNPVYSTFGMNLNYQRGDGDASLGSPTTNNEDQSSSSPFYNNINISTDSGGAAFNDTSRNSLFNNLNNQLNASDSSNIFSDSSSFSSDYSRNPFQIQRQGESTTATGKTYSSVLHPTTSQLMGLSALQQQHQQQQQQTSDRLTLFEIQQRLSMANCEPPFHTGQSSNQAILQQGNINQQQQHHQLVNEPNCLLNQFLSGQQHGHRNLSFQASTHHHHQQHQSQQTKPTGLSSIYHHRSNAATVGGSASAANLGRQLTGSAGSQMREKMAGSNMLGGSGGGGAGTTTRRRNKSPFFSGGNYLGEGQPGFKLDAHGTGVVNSDESERFSRKVFVGGLPPDIDEEEIKASFRRFGALVVDWPHKAESKSYFPPKGYAFLLFQEESSVQSLIDSCFQEEDKLYLCVSSPTIKDKPVQIRPWRLSDSDFVLDSTLTLDPRKTVFVGGVPRPLKASELATIMNNLYGGVCYAGIDTDPELKYPKGAGRVAFSNHQSYIAAISARFVHIHHSEIEKRVEVKPYVLDDQFCDECHGSKCNNKFAPFFCANITCLRYYCDNCWSAVHSQPGKEFHKPLVKEGGDRPRGAQSFKW
uniref:Putative RNA-binding protein orb2 n=1 Tax=Aceria tosichella TaxID=561515 RepID=A0A6G1SQ08_9ACAR